MPKAGKEKTQALETLHETIEGGTPDQGAGLVLNGAEASASDDKTGAAIEILHETIEGHPKAAEAALDMLHETVKGDGQESRNGDAAQPHADRTGGAAEAVERPMRQAARNMQGVTETGAVLARGFQDLSREWISFAQNQWRTNWNGLTGLARCRTPRDVLELQSAVVRENLQGVLDSAQRVSEISTEVAKDVVRTIGSRAA